MLIRATPEKRRSLFWEAGLGTFAVVSWEWKGSTASGGGSRQSFRRLDEASSTPLFAFFAFVEPLERAVVRAVRRDERRCGRVPLGRPVRPAHLLFRDQAGRPLSPFFLGSRRRTHLADGHGVADTRHFAVGVIRVLTGWDVDGGPLSTTDSFSDRAHAAGPLSAAADSKRKHTSATAAMMFAEDASSAIPGLATLLRELHGVVSATLQRSMGLFWRHPRGRTMHPTRDAVVGVSSSRALSEGASSTQLVDAMMELMPAQRSKRPRAALDGAPIGCAGAPSAETRRTLSGMSAAAPQTAGELPLPPGIWGHGGGTTAGLATATDAAGRTRKRPRRARALAPVAVSGRAGHAPAALQLWQPQPCSRRRTCA